MLESFFSRVQTRGPRSMMQPFAPASIRPLPPWLHRFNHLAWLPPAVLLALEIVLYIAPGEVILGGISWIPLASLLLTTVASEVVAALASLSFLDGGLPAALPMGAGMFAYGMSNFLASLALSGNHLDTASAISGLGLGMASLFSLAAAWETLSARGRHSMKPRRLSLLGAYGLVLLLVGAVAWAAHYGLFPHFFVMGTGNTLVELIVHIFALCAFLVSAGLLLASSRREHSDVLSWYALGLALIGVGLAGVFGYSFIDSLEAWVSRAAIYLGVAYLLTAMLVDMREGRHLSIPRAVLRETYGRYASLVETSADAVLLLADGICVFANPAAMKLFGSSSAQALLGASLRGQLLPDNNRMIEEEIHAMPGESRSSQAWQGKILMMDGQPVEVEGVHALVEYEGRHAVQVVLRDISERTRAERALRENEMRFRSVLDNSQDVIYRLNMQTSCYEYISPSAMTVVGFSADELIAMNMPTALSMVHPDDLPVMRAALARLEETGREEMEYRQLAKNGGWRWISNRVSLTLDAVGRPLYRDGNIRDITERKRAEEALEGANRQLRQKEAELREAHRI
ncbi:MAG: PAS domain S-box protein, partial [Spirochaetia bacterium]